MDEKVTYQKYQEILKGYLNDQDEERLYQAQQLSRVFLENQKSPEDIISIHYEMLKEMLPELPQDIRHSFDFLIEIMMGHGLAYREHQSLRIQQLELQSEIAVASNMQETLLKTETPKVSYLDIGAVSVPARQMNGDYYHFVNDEYRGVGVAVADVIGKGVPAALSMSMIKYSMDSLPETRMRPGAVLGSINRVVEQNVDPSMFITMFYGMYDSGNHQFQYASAGHEPGLLYKADQDEFLDIEAKGLVLGVSKNTKYKDYNIKLEIGDMVILLTDGVTECRFGDDFIDRERIIDLIKDNINLSAQEICENVYYELEKLQGFELRDDITIIILKREV